MEVGTTGYAAAGARAPPSLQHCCSAHPSSPCARFPCLLAACPSNNRVLFFPAGTTSATVVYGQSSMSGFSSSAYGTNGLHNPDAIAFDAVGNLYVADEINSRVLVFPTGGVVGGLAQPALTFATNVYGQADFNSNAGDQGSAVSADGFRYPTGVAVDGGGSVYVADRANNRVMFFPSGQTPGQQVATRVYGH